MTLQQPTDILDPNTLLTDGTQVIGGEWVPARSGETIAVENPATGEVLAHVPRSAEADVDDAVNAAQEAFPAWRDLSPSRRGQLLLDWAALCREHASDIDLLERLEVGRPKWGPPGAGGPMPGILTFTAGLADKATGSTLPSAFPDVIGMTLREPYGVCGGIIPWNAPGPNTVNDAGPAIAMGNTIVIKPAEDAPLTCLLLVKLAHEAGIPAGVINVVTGLGPEAGEPLARHPLVRRMSFTGSPETGRRVMEACASHLIPLHLELGGKSPQVVLRDAPLEKAIPTIARSITLNTGQICAAGSRVVVDASIREQVVSGLADEFKRVRVGPWYEDVDMGPLISAKQQQRVLGYLDAAAPRARRSWSAVASPRASGSTAAISCSRRSSTRSARTCGSPRRRSSGRCCRCSAPRTMRRRCRSPTAPGTGWWPRYGLATWAGPCASPGGSRPARCRSTRCGRAG